MSLIINSPSVARKGFISVFNGIPCCSGDKLFILDGLTIRESSNGGESFSSTPLRSPINQAYALARDSEDTGDVFIATTTLTSPIYRIYALSEIKRVGATGTPIAHDEPPFQPMRLLSGFSLANGIRIQSNYLARIVSFAFDFNFTERYYVNPSNQNLYLTNSSSWGADRGQSFRTISLFVSGAEGKGVISSTLCESRDSVGNFLGMLFDAQKTGLYKILLNRTNGETFVEYSPISGISSIQGTPVCNCTSDGKIWAVFPNGTRFFSPNEGRAWFAQPTLNFGLVNAFDNFKISADGKNHMIRTSGGMFISTNYGY